MSSQGCSHWFQEETVNQEVEAPVKVAIKIRPIDPKKKLMWTVEGSTLVGSEKHYNFGRLKFYFFRNSRDKMQFLKNYDVCMDLTPVVEVTKLSLTLKNFMSVIS